MLRLLLPSNNLFVIPDDVVGVAAEWEVDWKSEGQVVEAALIDNTAPTGAKVAGGRSSGDQGEREGG